MKSGALVWWVAIFAWAGCGREEGSGGMKSGGSEGAEEESAVFGTREQPRELRIEVGDHMQFSRTRIVAGPGETLRVVLVHSGRAAKEVMGHNWVLLRPGVDVTAFANAAVGAGATDYVPAARAGDVWAHTRLLGAGARDAVVFTVPADAVSGSAWPFLCTFPAHLQLGMRGVLVVR